MVNNVNIIGTKTDLFSEHKAAFYVLLMVIGLVCAGLLGALFYGLWRKTGKNSIISYQHRVPHNTEFVPRLSFKLNDGLL